MGGGTLIIANLGDWTRRMNDLAKINRSRSHYWTRGIPTLGVLCMAQPFRRVVIVTTGSGIGLCLGTLTKLSGTTCRVIWCASKPEQNFGDLPHQVRKIDPQALIIDIQGKRKLKLEVLAWRMYTRMKAEAVFCVNNRDVTRKLIYDLESRGVAFGPIWDS